MSDLRLMHWQEMIDLLGTASYGKPGVAEGTNVHTIKTVAACVYSVGGQMYSKAITDNIAMDAAAAQADLSTAWYLISLNAAGTVHVTKGTETLTASYDATARQLPSVPAGDSPLAAMKIVTSGGTFTSGTTDLSGTGVTATFFDIGRVPLNTPA